MKTYHGVIKGKAIQLVEEHGLADGQTVTVFLETAGTGEEAIPAASGPAAAWAFPVLTDANWPAGMPLTRAEMYDDDGR